MHFSQKGDILLGSNCRSLKCRLERLKCNVLRNLTALLSRYRIQSRINGMASTPESSTPMKLVVSFGATEVDNFVTEKRCLPMLVSRFLKNMDKFTNFRLAKTPQNKKNKTEDVSKILLSFFSHKKNEGNKGEKAN